MLPDFPWLPLPAAGRTVPWMLCHQAKRYGDRALFSCQGQVWSFAQVPDLVARAAGALRACGIKPKDRVAILSPNRSEMLLAIMACGWLGAIAVPINIAVKTRQLRFYLENSGAQLLIADGALLAALEPQALAGLPVKQVWCLDERTDRDDLGVGVFNRSFAASPVDAAQFGHALRWPSRGVQRPRCFAKGRAPPRHTNGSRHSQPGPHDATHRCRFR